MSRSRDAVVSGVDGDGGTGDAGAEPVAAVAAGVDLVLELGDCGGFVGGGGFYDERTGGDIEGACPGVGGTGEDDRACGTGKGTGGTEGQGAVDGDVGRGLDGIDGQRGTGADDGAGCDEIGNVLGPRSDVECR